MSNSKFRSQSEELAYLLRQIEEVRQTLKEVNAATSRIDRHVRRVFDIPKKPAARASDTAAASKPAIAAAPAISVKDAQDLFDDLSLLYTNGNAAEVKDRLDRLPVPELRVLSRELGVTMRSRSSKKSLCAAIIGRLNERAMLSKNLTLQRRQS